MKPEILAPAGNEEALKAAIKAGCDAVYFALPNFGARAYAENFTMKQTKEMIAYCHLYGVKVYITMNTLLYEDEFEQAYQCAKQLHEYNVDALIIQDLGFIHYLHVRLPELELHASTQLSVSKPEMMEQLKKLGVKRVVLARETSIEDIEACVKTGIEVEVFVHGALCICYSGQCYFSSFKYNRSGNRGMCAQPCRMPYQLLQDGKQVETDGEYLLSPKDISLIQKVNELARIGVVSLKIEGRMKSKEYVYQSVSLVRKAVDKQKITKEDLEKLNVSFNRGHTYGHTYNDFGSQLMNYKSSNHAGIEIGKVIKIKNKKIVMSINKELNQNDGIRFEYNGNQQGCRINFLYDESGKLTNHVDAHKICMIDDLKHVKVGSVIKKTIDSKLEQEVNTKLKENSRQVSIDAQFTCYGVSDLLECIASDGKNVVTCRTQSKAVKAMNRATNDEVITKQFMKTKDSWAVFKNMSFDLEPDIYFSISDINQLRRDVLDALKEKRTKLKPIVEKEYNVNLSPVEKVNNIMEIQTKNQYTNFDGIIVSELLPFTMKKGNITEVQGDVVAHLGEGKIIDSMNVTNSYAIAALMSLGYENIVVSDEVDDHRLSLMLASFKKQYGFDAPVIKTIYQKRRLMTMNYCPVNTCLKDGSRTQCSLCHTHQFELVCKDQTHLLCLGDGSCHMRLFEKEACDEMYKLDFYKELGIKGYRFVFVDENEGEIQSILNSFC